MLLCFLKFLHFADVVDLLQGLMCLPIPYLHVFTCFQPNEGIFLKVGYESDEEITFSCELCMCFSKLTLQEYYHLRWIIVILRLMAQMVKFFLHGRYLSFIPYFPIQSSFGYGHTFFDQLSHLRIFCVEQRLLCSDEKCVIEHAPPFICFSSHHNFPFSIISDHLYIGNFFYWFRNLFLS